MKSLIYFLQRLVDAYYFLGVCEKTHAHENYIVEFTALVDNHFNIVVSSDCEVNIIINYGDNGVTVESFTPSFHGIMARIFVAQLTSIIDYCRFREHFFRKMQ